MLKRGLMQRPAEATTMTLPDTGYRDAASLAGGFAAWRSARDT